MREVFRHDSAAAIYQLEAGDHVVTCYRCKSGVPIGCYFTRDNYVMSSGVDGMPTCRDCTPYRRNTFEHTAAEWFAANPCAPGVCAALHLTADLR
jgi:hypothetical protein